MNELGNHFVYRTLTPFCRKLERGKNVGEIIYLDRFGNLVTNFLWEDLLLSGKPTVKINSKVIMKFSRYIFRSKAEYSGLCKRKQRLG